METKGIYQLHEEHTQWLNNLTFYKDEMAIMQNRIAEVATKNNSQDVLKQIEHFQNQLIIQKEQMDILSHEIREHESGLVNEVKKNEVAVDHRKMPDHNKHREGVAAFEKIFNDLRKELNQFLTKWM